MLAHQYNNYIHAKVLFNTHCTCVSPDGQLETTQNYPL